MRLQAVTTTGIYCRADCVARPEPANVRPVRSALVALAQGYRPCLRCRPDRLPDLGLDQPPLEVAHAVRLVAEGFLDEHTTDQLAARIGYSTRHLVRLFEQHVGATPDFVARACRAHLARRLLDDSALSITQVAFAAGFASLRQMNRVVRELFAFAPSELRRRARAAVPDALDGGLRLRVPYRGPFDGRAVIDYLRGRAIPGIESVHDGTYRRTMNTCGHPGVVDVRDAGDGHHLDVTMHLATFGSILEQVERVRSMFGLHRDSTEPERALRRDELLGPLVRRRPGMRLPGAFDRFETTIRIVIGQQISVAGASTVCGRLVERYGEPIAAPLPGGRRYLFPSAERLSAAQPHTLGMPVARARTIIALARAVAVGELDLTRPASLDDTLARLTALPGIGPWTANLIAARVFAAPDAFPASDLGLRKAAAALLGRARPLTADELEALSQRWRPFRATAMTYLWTADVPRANARAMASGGA